MWTLQPLALGYSTWFRVLEHYPRYFYPRGSLYLSTAGRHMVAYNGKAVAAAATNLNSMLSDMLGIRLERVPEGWWWHTHLLPTLVVWALTMNPSPGGEIYLDLFSHLYIGKHFRRPHYLSCPSFKAHLLTLSSTDFLLSYSPSNITESCISVNEQQKQPFIGMKYQRHFASVRDPRKTQEYFLGGLISCLFWKSYSSFHFLPRLLEISRPWGRNGSSQKIG